MGSKRAHRWHINDGVREKEARAEARDTQSMPKRRSNQPRGKVQSSGSAATSEPAEGVVKWFNDAKGYGFIRTMRGSETVDVYVHFSAIEMQGFKSLKTDQKVRFEMVQSSKGFQATNVRLWDR